MHSIGQWPPVASKCKDVEAKKHFRLYKIPNPVYHSLFLCFGIYAWHERGFQDFTFFDEYGRVYLFI